MANQRQRLARKRFKAEHPERFPKTEPTPPKDPSKKKKKRSSAFKPKRTESKPGSWKRHPLRVPGMKPGESCFICKAPDHIAKLCPEKTEWEKNKICLRCRRRGHRATNCPEVQDAANDVKCCYNCGETGHSLSLCPYPLVEGGTKFAECFVCHQQGHLSKNCPINSHGIYPKGGCCKICGGVTHLAKDCPDKGWRGSVATNGPAGRSMRIEESPRGQVTKFISGDDIEDDFMMDEIRSGDNNKSANSNNGNVKETKKYPKVVIFN